MIFKKIVGGSLAKIKNRASALKVPPLFKRKKYLSFLIVAVLVFAVVFVLLMKNSPSVTSKCSNNLERSRTFITDGNPREAYTQLNTLVEECSPNDKQSEVQIGAEQKDLASTDNIRYECALAVSAYQSGEKGEAKIHAEKATKAASNLSEQETAKVPEFDKMMNILAGIVAGFYYPKLSGGVC